MVVAVGGGRWEWEGEGRLRRGTDLTQRRGEAKTTTRAATDGKHAAPWRKEVRSDKAIDQELPDRQVKTLLDGGVPFCFSWDSFYLFLLLMSNIHN